MYTSVLLPLAALGATVVVAAPTHPKLNANAASPDSLETVSEYFNMLAAKVEQSRLMAEAPICDLSNAAIALNGSSGTLPEPSAGLTLKHVAIGRGTQNYTCDTTNATAAPTAVGALASLFNATCLAAAYPDLLAMLPKVALQFNLTDDESELAPSNLAVSGKHFFADTSTPFFNLDVDSALQLGEAPCAKNNSVTAPAGAVVGQDGSAAVAWLKLLARSGATGDLQEVYRVETAGGSAPATCAGMPASFTVQYSAQYWFYQHPE